MIQLTTVMENVLYEMLLETQGYINDITSGDNSLNEDEIRSINEEINNKVKDYFKKEECIIVIHTYSNSHVYAGEIKVYHMDDLTGELELLETITDEYEYGDLQRKYLNQHYKLHWFTRNENDINHKDNIIARMKDDINDTIAFIEIDGSIAEIQWLETED